MDTRFWGRFWTTGMPEAWLMSRDEEGPASLGPEVELGQRLPGPPVGPPYPPVGGVPGNPGNLY